MRKHTILFLLPLLLLTGCAKKSNVEILEKGSAVKLIVATDLHYISPSIVEEGAMFSKTYLGGDGKQMNYIDVIVDAFIDDVSNQRPDGLILSGDLTFNGEKASHKELAGKLLRLKNEGIPIYVIPGNHDINNFNAVEFKGENLVYTDTISAPEFKEIYQGYGYDTAYSRDEDSLSYLSELSEDLWLIVLDTSIYENNSKKNPSQPNGSLSDKTYNWLEKQLKEAQSQGKTCISVSHHNIMPHNDMFREVFTLDNNNRLLDLYDQYGVTVNVSGHIHVQHIGSAQAKNHTIYDIVTSALGVYTNQYGVIEFLPAEEISYYTQPVDIEDWAKKNASKDVNLLDFETYSYDFFYAHSYDNLYERLAQSGYSEDDSADIADTAAILNAAYFSGTINQVRDEILSSPKYKLLKNQPEGFIKEYIDSLLVETEDENNITIPLN